MLMEETDKDVEQGLLLAVQKRLRERMGMLVEECLGKGCIGTSEYMSARTKIADDLEDVKDAIAENAATSS